MAMTEGYGWGILRVPTWIAILAAKLRQQTHIWVIAPLFARGNTLI
jgi:hypothetical protein